MTKIVFSGRYITLKQDSFQLVGFLFHCLKAPQRKFKEDGAKTMLGQEESSSFVKDNWYDKGFKFICKYLKRWRGLLF